MSTRTEIEAGIRSWLKLAGSAAGLTDAQVVIADQHMPRPAPPYLTVKVVTLDIPIGEDEQLVNAVPEYRSRGQRRALVSINAYGETAVEWLERACTRLRHPAVQAVIDAAGLTLRTDGGLNDLSALVDTSIETRGQRDIEVTYAVVTDAEGVTELLTVESTNTYEGGSPADLVETHTVTL